MKNVYKNFLENKLAHSFRKLIGKPFLPIEDNKNIDIPLLKMVEEKSNWILPFDTCSLLVDDDKILSVKFETYEELPDHIPSLQDTHSFIYIIGGSVAISGKFYVQEKDINNEEGIVPINEGDLKDVLILLEDLGTFNEKAYELYIVVQAELLGIKQKSSVLPYVGRASTWINISNMVDNGEDTSAITTAINRRNDDISTEEDKIPYTELKKDLLTFIHTFSFFMLDPKNFIVETRDVKYKPSKKIYKPIGISLYSIVHINTIRKKYVKRETCGGEESTLTVGHERRRHLRTYRHERYVNMRGKTVVIKSTWIGPTKAVDKVNKRLYKIHINTK